MRRYYLITTIFVITLLFGCVSQHETNPAQTDHATISTTIAISESDEPRVEMSATPNDSATITAIRSTDSAIMTRHVVQVENAQKVDYGWGNTLIGWDKKEGSFILLELTSFTKQELPGEKPSLGTSMPFAISPDRTKLAYIDYLGNRNSQLRIVLGNGTEEEIENWPTEYLWVIIGWLDNQRISLTNLESPDGTIFVFDISSGEISEFPPFFEAETEEGELLMTGNMAVPFVHYDASLSRVLIIRIPSDNRIINNYEFWDADTNEILWSDTGYSGSDDRPAWSSEGSNFVVSIAPKREDQQREYCAELYMVTNSGEQILLLNCVWGSSSWSPDGDSLATWGVECEESCAFVDQKVLNIFDITEGKDEVYSIYPGDIEGVISTAQYPIWSPDNQFIAFTTYDGTLSPVETIILDLTRDKAFILPETMEVLGWMRAEP